MARYGLKHGLYKTKTYKTWQSMKSRCDNPNDPSYPRYGGRGISYTTEWEEFSAFLKDMGARAEGTTLERLDNNGNYEPTNCIWATTKEQTRNRRDTNLITFKGKTQCFLDWCVELEIARSTMYNRLKRGWSLERAFTTPVRRKYARDK